jgi:hypothetical protein
MQCASACANAMKNTCKQSTLHEAKLAENQRRLQALRHKGYNHAQRA